jgi:hypothetical protein
MLDAIPHANRVQAAAMLNARQRAVPSNGEDKEEYGTTP